LANHGKNARTYINGYDLTTYLKSFSVIQSADVVDVSAFNQESKTYIVGLRDGTISAEGFFAGSTLETDYVFNQTLASTSIWTYYPNRSGVGQPGYGIKTDQTSYEIMSPVDGAVGVTVAGQATLGVDNIISHIAFQTRASSGVGTAYDNLVATTGGILTYLQLDGITGGITVTVNIQHSSAGTSWATVQTFASSVRTAQRASTGTNIKRYTRTSWTFSGAGTAAFNTGVKRL